MTERLDQLCTYATTTAGRDKLFRLVQMQCKMLKWLLAGSSKETLDTISQVMSAMSLSRGALRFLREWPALKSFQVAFVSLLFVLTEEGACFAS